MAGCRLLVELAGQKPGIRSAAVKQGDARPPGAPRQQAQADACGGGLIRRPSGRNNAELTAVLSKLLLRASLAATALQSASTQCSAFFLTLGALSASLQGPGR